MENEELEKEKKRIEDEDALVPANEIKHKMVSTLLREYYDEEVLEHLSLTKAQVKMLHRGLRTLNKNFIRASCVLVCKGPDCPMSEKCIVQKAGAAPVGKSCPVESMLVDQWTGEYIDDLAVDRQSKIEMDLVYDMIEADLIDWRTSHDISQYGLYDWQTIAVTEQGKPIRRKEESVALSIKQRFKARKDRLREDLMATRKIKAKFGLDKKIDPSRYASDLHERYKNISADEGDYTDVEGDNSKKFIDKQEKNNADTKPSS